jgi:hypothetical protein
MKKRAAQSAPGAAKKAKQALRPLGTPPTLRHGAYTREELLQTVAQHGYCVIEGVLRASKTDEYLERFYDAYASLHHVNADGTTEALGLDPRHPATLTRDKIPPYKGNGIINVPGVCALRVSEDVRADADVTRVFALWHDTDELVTSFDRASLFAPNQAREGLAPHVDANARQPERAARERTLQSAVILHTNATATDQGFVVWPGHHNDIGKWNRRGDAPNRDWCTIADEWLDELGTGFVINPPAGSQIVWLSTTVHGNTSGTRQASVGRVAIYVSKAPAGNVSTEARATLVRARLHHTTLGHDVVRPAAQTPGNGRFKNPISHRFEPEHLVTYQSESDIPALLMARVRVD